MTMNKQDLTTDEALIRRRCSCGEWMPAEVRETEDYEGPGQEDGIRFSCQACDKTVFIADSRVIFTSLFIGLFLGAGIIYSLVNGLVEFMVYGLSYSVFSFFGTLLLLIVVGLFLYGTWAMLYRGISQLRDRYTYSLQEPNTIKDGIQGMFIPMGLGLLPWLIAIGIGYLNDTYIRLPESANWLIVAIAFSPVIFAKKLGSSITAAFISAAIWLFVGAGLYFIF